MKIILCLFLFIGISCSKQNEDIVWNYLKQEGLTDAGAPGLMGNIYCESGVESVIYEWYYHDSIGLTNEQYVAQVNSGNTLILSMTKQVLDYANGPILLEKKPY